MGGETLQSLALSLSEAMAENERLRAALAQSDLPCAYCSLPKDEWAKCASGFPGCDRADDAMGCPELGARLSIESATRQRDEALAALKASEERVTEQARVVRLYCTHNKLTDRLKLGALTNHPYFAPSDPGTEQRGEGV